MKNFLPALFLLLVGCASAEPNYYTLSEMDGAAQTAPAMTIEIRRPFIPAYLDRPEMIDKSGYRIARDDGQVWAEPLDQAIERTLALDLGQRLPGSTVLTETGNLNPQVSYKVDADIQQFDSNHNGHSSMTVVIVLSDQSGVVVRTGAPLVLTGESASTGAAMAAALSDMTGQLADHIARDLQK